MKKVLFVFVTVFSLFATRSNAQLQKGNVLVGGDLANFNIGLKKDAGFDIQLSPKAAWFIKDNIALGAMLDLGVSKANSAGPTTTNYGISALGRYYFGPSEVNTESVLKHTRVFAEANVGIVGINQSNGGGSTNGLGIGFGPGIAYFITPNIGLETLLKYNPTVGFGDVGFQSNLNLSVGFQIYLPGNATKNKVMKDANKM